MSVPALRRVGAGDFARTFAGRPQQFAWFFGAGTSAAAGIPTGVDMILDFKTRLFCQATGLVRREIDPGDPLWAERITAYFDGQHGFPTRDDPREYAVAFAAAYPDSADRRRYIEAAVRRGRPSFGHRVVAALVASGQLPCLFTTNFDDLPERAVAVASDLLPAGQQPVLTVAALDSADRAERCLRESAWPLLAQLHGDYRSEELKNIDDELRTQDERLRRVLVEACQRFGLVVVGYSGRDESVMEALREAIRPGAFPAGLFWVAPPAAEVSEAARRLLHVTAEAGITTAIVDSANFDELAADIDRQIELPGALAAHVRAERPSPRVVPVELPAVHGQATPVLRCSALPVLALPSRGRQIQLAEPLTTPQAREVMKAAGARGAVAALGRRLVAFGTDADLANAFAAHGAVLDGDAALDPVADSWALGLIYDSLIRALSWQGPLRPRLRSRGHSLILADVPADRDGERAARNRQALKAMSGAYGGPLTGIVPDLGAPYAEAVGIHLDRHLGRWWCVFDPFTSVDLPRPAGGDRPAEGTTERLAVRRRVPGGDPAGDWRRERWAQRYNQRWAAIIDAWAKLLAPNDPTTVRAFGVKSGAGVDAEFTLGATTAWSHPAAQVAAVGSTRSGQ